jgi:hypothetical protein
MMRLLLVCLLLILGSPGVAQEKFVGSNVDQRLTLAFKASDAEVQKRLPEGWEVNPPRPRATYQHYVHSVVFAATLSPRLVKCSSRVGCSFVISQLGLQTKTPTPYTSAFPSPSRRVDDDHGAPGACFTPRAADEARNARNAQRATQRRAAKARKLATKPPRT